jgi:polyferredoxin
MRKLLLVAYVAVAVLTLIFQIHVRSGVCGDGCTLSYAKGVMWAVIWPVSWPIYISGMVR